MSDPTKRSGLLVLAALVLALVAACSSTAAGPGSKAPSSPSSTSVPSSVPTSDLPATPTATPSAPGCPPAAPAWTGTGTVFGVNVSTSSQSYPEAVDGIDRTFGRVPAVRVFDPTVPPPSAWANRGALLAGRMVVASFRMPPSQVLAGTYDAELRHWFRGVPAGVELFWSYFHEPESEIADGHFSAEEYRRAFRHVVALAQSTCRADLFPTLVLTGYTLDPQSGRDWRRYYPGPDFVSVLAWDPYNNASGSPTRYEDPAVLFGPVVEASRGAGKPFGIAETGSQLVPGDDGRGRARWLREVADYLREQHAVFVLYYSSIGTSGADYRLLDRPSIRAWRADVRAGRARETSTSASQ